MKQRIFYFGLTLILSFNWGSVVKAFTLLTLSADSLYDEFWGIVSDEEGEKLAYAVIMVENSNISTVTNRDGKFTIKIPHKLLYSDLHISFLGYKTYIVPIVSLKDGKNHFRLKIVPFVLPELEVLMKDPESIVQQMLNNISTNYATEPRHILAFYRERIKKRHTNISLSEAIVEIYKRSYMSNGHDLASLYKSRKSTDYNKLDTLVFKLAGGPYNNIYLDIMKHPQYFFTETPFETYDFQFLRTEQMDSRMIYVISFEQRRSMAAPLFYGELFVDAQSFALVKARFDMNLKNNAEATRVFIRKKPFNARISTTQASYMVAYRPIGDKWYYSYSRIDLGFKINWKRRIFNTNYNTTIEMAATDWERAGEIRNFIKKENRISPSVVIQDEASGFSDVEFWGKYNVIEPDNSIENAIRKIQKQLEKRYSSNKKVNRLKNVEQY